MKTTMPAVLVTALAASLFAGCSKPEELGPRVRKECESLAAVFADLRTEAGKDLSETTHRTLVQSCVMAHLEGRGR